MEEVQFENLKAQARLVGKLVVTIQGADGEQIIATSGDAVKSGLPDEIRTITFDSAAALKSHNLAPIDRFNLRLDFTEPPSFDSYKPWDQPTPNGSLLEVVGTDHTWVTGTYESTLSFFRRRGRKRAWAHSQRTFNALNWLLGFPAALWIIYRLDSFGVGVSSMHTALLGALYVYVFLLALLLFRGMIWIVRWMFPVIEFQGARNKTVRVVVGGVVSSLVAALLYDVMRTLVWSQGGNSKSDCFVAKSRFWVAHHEIRTGWVFT